MFLGRPAFNLFLKYFMSSLLLICWPFQAAGFNTFNVRWRGGLNPYRLGADLVYQSGWTSGLSVSASGAGDGMLYSPRGVVLDSSGNLYVTEAQNHRISKYNSSGVFQGWIGKILTSPTGGAAGCNGAAVGTATPGWCTGGTATSGTGDGMLNGPGGLSLDSAGNLYVVDPSNHRIQKFNSSGVFQGWIGKILTSPTGGAAGCNGAAVGTATPGWCTGGTGGTGTGDGMMSNPQDLELDSSGNIYVVEFGSHRISKYDSSGVFQGWIGNIATSPTGGAAGCNGAAVGTFTPGWCMGGTGGTGTGDGMMNSPSDITMDSSGNIYVAIITSARISKYDSSGAFQGWIGKIATSPTGGAAGCNGAAVGTFTPGWCTGGTAANGTGDGMLNSPRGVVPDSAGNIYVADSTNNRINKYNSSGVSGGAIQTVKIFYSWHRSTNSPASGTGDGMLNTPTNMTRDSSGNIYISDINNARINKYDSSGAFIGWIGKVFTSPTGGAAGCNGAAVGTATPGWCTGGGANAGNGNGMFSAPRGLALDSSGNLYVADSNNNRIQKFNSSGVFQGWIGKIAGSPTGGDAGCNGAAVGTFTPGWCTGGTAASGTGDGMMNFPNALRFDSSDNLYVADYTNHRINKYNSAGAFQGWIGKIATSPTGGAAGCNGAAVGTATPGWCTGGTSASGTGNGMMNSPQNLALDSSGNLYVADTNNDRVQKFNSSGAFQGWIGKIATSPTGGAAGCNGAAVGTATPGWCTGGTSTSGTGDGMINDPEGIVLDSAGNLYVADYNNRRIQKFNSAGAFQGWIGNIGTSPTGGAAGCNGAAVGSLTPGWCTGGTGTYGSGDGMMSQPMDLFLDSSGDLYVVEAGNYRVTRFSIQGR